MQANTLPLLQMKLKPYNLEPGLQRKYYEHDLAYDIIAAYLFLQDRFSKSNKLHTSERHLEIRQLVVQ